MFAGGARRSRTTTSRWLVVAAALAATGVGVLGPGRVGAAAQPDSPTLSTTNRLDDRRYVVAGPRAFAVGTQAGRWPAMGFHTRGEMGGIWSPPIKLLDGIWFGIDGAWVAPATRFTSGYGYVAMELPGPGSIDVERVEFVPEGRRALVIGLTFTNAGDAQSFTLDVDAHSELMGAYPWGETTPDQRTFNRADTGAFDGGRLVFREQGRPHPNAEAHDWAAAVGSSLTPVSHETGPNFRGPQDPPVICPASGPGSPPQPPRCDDTAYGKGSGGRLSYAVDVAANSSRTVWVAVAGSDEGLGAAQQELTAALANPQAALEAKLAERLDLANRTRVSLPADPLLEQGIEWSKQNLADSIQEARGLEVRETNAGVNYPAPEGRVDRVRFLAAGFPDYPWLFATDGEYTAFAGVAAGQFAPTKDHLRALRDVSLIDNGNSGKVVHEVVTDGSVYFGSNADPGNTDETAKFPSAVALVWRWTGDNAFRDEMYAFAKLNLQYIFRELDVDGDGWPEGLGNVEREGMGEEKLDNTVYTIRGLYDLADMARSKRDSATATWAMDRARRLERAFEPAWWMPQVPQHADSLDDPGNVKVQQRHWIGVTPMEVQLDVNGKPVPGLTTFEHGNAALDLRETPCYGTDFGLFHTGAPGCDPAASSAPAERTIFTLNTAIMAVGEGNYGRLGSQQQRRFTTANRRLQLPDPDEQPGAMPEIAPSPDYGRSIDRLFTERAMVLQAWGNYGTLWPVVAQQLGVRPDLGRGRLEITPQVPPGAPSVGGDNIRLAAGFVDVEAAVSGNEYRTTVHLGLSAKLTIGHTIPRSATASSVTLNGRAVPYSVRVTNRGREVLVEGTKAADQTLIVRT